MKVLAFFTSFLLFVNAYSDPLLPESLEPQEAPETAVSTEVAEAPEAQKPPVSEIHWRVLKDSPIFSLSAEFDFLNEKKWDGKVVRSGGLCPRYYYDLFDSENAFIARGITRVFSLGFLYSWAMDIDVYDSNTYIGSIQGKMATKARSKFSFYNAAGEEIGIAYLNEKSANFILVSPKEEGIVLAELKGEVFGDMSSWQINILKQPFSIDERLFKIFAAFVSDYDSRFLPQPEVVHHHHYHKPN